MDEYRVNPTLAGKYKNIYTGSILNVINITQKGYLVGYFEGQGISEYCPSAYEEIKKQCNCHCKEDI